MLNRKEIPFATVKPTGRPKVKTVDEARVLLDHGTAQNYFTPGTVYECAKADLRHREYNARILRERDEYRNKGYDWREVMTEKTIPYAFLRRHVTKAKQPSDVLKAALAEWPRGVQDGDVQRCRLYRGKGQIEAALELALAAEASPSVSVAA